MTNRTRTAAPRALERLAWFFAGLALAGSFSESLRQRLRDSHELHDACAWFLTSAAVVFSGVSLQSLTGFLAAIGTASMGVASILRELRLGRRADPPR